MVSKKKHPTFQRTNFGRTRRSRVKDNWRRPRGIDNKQREKYAYMGKLPSIGYKNPKALRGKHPSGLEEVIVFSPAEVAGLKNVVVRIASSVGARKAALIIKACTGAKIRVLNPAKGKWEKKAKPAKKEKKQEQKVEQPKKQLVN